MKLMDIAGYYIVEDYARFNGVDRWDGSILVTDNGYFEGYSIDRCNNEKIFICGWLKGEEISVHQLVDTIDYKFEASKKDGFIYNGMFGETVHPYDDMNYLGECSIIISNSYKKKSSVVSIVSDLKDQLFTNDGDIDNYCRVSMVQQSKVNKKLAIYS